MPDSDKSLARLVELEEERAARDTEKPMSTFELVLSIVKALCKIVLSICGLYFLYVAWKLWTAFNA